MRKLVAFVLALSMMLSALSMTALADGTAAAPSYIFKDSVSTMSTNWNPHTYQTTDDSYPAEFIRVGLYNLVFNDELHPVEGKAPYEGYKFISEMAASEPVDITEKIKAERPEFGIPEQATKGYAYTIDLNPNAVWEDGTPINADTYVYSMAKLLDVKLLNYRAMDYYSSDFAIAGAEVFANSGRSIKKINSSDGAAMTYQMADLVKGEDGIYATAEGYKAYFGLNEGYQWMGGNSLADYYGAEYIPEEVWSVLSAAADEDGFAPVTDETIAALHTFTGSDVWGNEPQEQLGYYVSYNFTYPVTDFSTVGCFKSGDYQITLVLAKSMSGFNLLYNLSSNWIVKEDLYEKCLTQTGDAWTSTYNTSVETTSSYGPYKMSYYETDKNMHFVKNDNWYGYTDGQHNYVDPVDGETYAMYMTTEIDTQVVAEASTRKLMFLKGQLMGYGLQAEDFATYRNSEYVHVTPSETIFFMILNGHKDAIESREANEGFDTTLYDLQTLTLNSFRRAVAVTYDKELLATTVSPARSGGYGLIGEAYIYDPETGSRYRDTDQAKKALCSFYSINPADHESLDAAVASITGYDPVKAKELYAQAFTESLAAGFITDADNDGKCDQTIRIEYAYSSASSFVDKLVAYLNEKMIEATVGTPFEGKIEFYGSAPYGNDWSNKIKAGMSDVVLGGWSGSALNPFSLTDLYCNPDQAYDGQWFDASSVTMEYAVPVNGVDTTLNMTLQKWSDALNGTFIEYEGATYNFGSDYADIETRLNILSALETLILGTYDYIPMLQDAGMSLLSQQVYYVVEEYNPIMGRGGITYMKYNYNEDEWKAYVESQPDGTLSY